jgi:hypothetical protein
MSRWIRGEIALGFVLATIFWTGVLGWQASYAPTEREKQECYEAAQKTGHKTEDCKTLWERTTTDPVALFTLVLAFSTIGLWAATIGLYLAGERGLKHAQEVAAQQTRDMKGSIAAADKAAKAAELNAQAVIESERARLYVIIEKETIAKEFQRIMNRLRFMEGVAAAIRHRGGDPKTMDPPPPAKLEIEYSFQNYGKTPAYIQEIGHGAAITTGVPKGRRYTLLTPLPVEAVIGADKKTGHISDIAMPTATIETVKSIRDGEATFWFHGSVEYDDTFGWRRKLHFVWHYDNMSDGFRLYSYRETAEKRETEND